MAGFDNDDGDNHDGHKPWRPQTMTMTATNHDGHKPWPWRPQTMTATNDDQEGHNNDLW